MNQHGVSTFAIHPYSGSGSHGIVSCERTEPRAIGYATTVEGSGDRALSLISQLQA
jgi:hypothetical protein